MPMVERRWVETRLALPLGRFLRGSRGGGHGLIRWPDRGEVIGWARQGERAALLYRWEGIPVGDRFTVASHPIGRYGGRAELGHCPGCGVRVRMLYLCDDGFRCRTCGGLRYLSQYRQRNRWSRWGEVVYGRENRRAPWITVERFPRSAGSPSPSDASVMP